MLIFSMPTQVHQRPPSSFTTDSEIEALRVAAAHTEAVRIITLENHHAERVALVRQLQILEHMSRNTPKSNARRLDEIDKQMIRVRRALQELR